MMSLIISAFLVVALLAGGAAAILRSRSLLGEGTAEMPTIQQLHNSANVDKLPAEDFEDRSLEYRGGARRSAPKDDQEVSLIGP